jgi:hypothetical protein
MLASGGAGVWGAAGAATGVPLEKSVEVEAAAIRLALPADLPDAAAQALFIALNNPLHRPLDILLGRPVGYVNPFKRKVKVKKWREMSREEQKEKLDPLPAFKRVAMWRQSRKLTDADKDFIWDKVLTDPERDELWTGFTDSEKLRIWGQLENILLKNERWVKLTLDDKRLLWGRMKPKEEDYRFNRVPPAERHDRWLEMTKAQKIAMLDRMSLPNRKVWKKTFKVKESIWS